MISSTDYRDHVVTEAAMEAGLTAGLDRFPAVCDHTVIVCSLYESPRPACPGCRERLAEPPKPRRPLRESLFVNWAGPRWWSREGFW